MKMRLNERWMALAIVEAEKNIKHMSGGPFGACIVKNGKLLAAARNTVLKNDATCHAEMNAIRMASKKTSSFDLSGCIIYSTTEPCPMCFSAIHWARIGAIVYGTSTKDSKAIGFNELYITDKRLKNMGASQVKIYGDFMVHECEKLLSAWNAKPDKKFY